MRRLSGNIKDNGEVEFSKYTLHHIQVLHLRVGEEIEILENNIVYKAKVESINPLSIVAYEKSNITRELACDITLFLPLLKNGNFDLCLQKATELGVKEIIPYVSKRTVVKLTKEDFSKRKARFEKIISSAVLQSNRNGSVYLRDLVKINDLTSFSFDKKYVAYEDESLQSSLIDKNTEFKSQEKIAIVIGCEGGFEKSEIDMLKENGYQIISLGKRILRAETAVIYSLSVLSYLMEV